MRRFAKIDANQQEIVEAMRKEGATVQSLAAIGSGCPDLLIGFNNRTILMEVKDGTKPQSKQALTQDQLKWHAAWKGGTLAIVDSVEAALRILAIAKAEEIGGYVKVQIE